ncbi:MAG TPA: J domain-containing protein, partial [Gemmatimonadaceae bacterium]|nr:J domain-containing protein [Gemmatimonadaceae bacterium]
MAPSKDYYAVLGVASTASADEIKKQYRRLARKHHPDANASDPQAAERFKEISEAYGVLGDEEKRKQYDDMRRLGAFGFGQGASPRSSRPSGGGSAGGARPGGSGTYQDFDIGGIGGLGDLFSSIFGAGGRPGGQRRASEKGQSVETTLEVPFRVAATGGKVPVELEVNEECATCGGNGAAPGASFKTCPECSGRGTISFGQGGFAVNRPCPMCLGRGQVPTERCHTCGGTGEVRTRKKVIISVPAGSDNGSRIRLKGQGGRGSNGGEPGDLVITIQVKPDRFYTRDGLDLVATVPINIAQATLGSRVSVRTLDGKKVALRIPAGTASGKRFRVRGQGVEKDGTRGDLIVEVAIAVPEKLTEEQEK